MRWPLKNQIFVRIILLLLLTIAAVTFANIRSAFSLNRSRELARVENIADVLTSSTRFPLTSGVLESMSSLSGAQFIVTDAEGSLFSKTSKAPIRGQDDIATLNADEAATTTVRIGDRDYLYCSVKTLGALNYQLPPTTITHIFMPQQSRTEVMWQAARAPVLIALITLPVALLISFAIAGQVTRPLAHLQNQVALITASEPVEVKTPLRNDEVRDLSLAINEMSVRLSDHDKQVRSNERLGALVQVGRGLAHNLRNSATGCKMAVELLVSEHPDVSQSDNITVARRQLNLMENYIRKFMHLAQTESDIEVSTAEQVELFEMLDKVIFLLSPSAAHLDVSLTATKQGNSASRFMPRDDAEQLMVNLIGNAIAASAESAVNDSQQKAQVEVSLVVTADDHVTLTVVDSGEGPPDEIADQIFDPFVSGKPEGTGLGLSLVHEIATRTGGRVHWKRESGKTIFEFEFGSSAS
ncbi:MAG: HAMP domain-containing sensor histidine kinase [Planctomycetota bacterium]